MDKGKIRVALAALSVAGLVAGMTLTGCASSGSCSSSGGEKMQQQPAGSSCGNGSCSGTKPAPKAPEMMK